MPKYRVIFPRVPTSAPVEYSVIAASREQAAKAATELYRYQTRGTVEPGTPKTIPVYGKINEEDD